MPEMLYLAIATNGKDYSQLTSFYAPSRQEAEAHALLWREERFPHLASVTVTAMPYGYKGGGHAYYPSQKLESEEQIEPRAPGSAHECT